MACFLYWILISISAKANRYYWNMAMVGKETPTEKLERFWYGTVENMHISS